MDQPIYVFESSASFLNGTSLVLSGLLLIFSALLYFVSKKEYAYAERKWKGLYSLLLSFAVLISGVTLLLNIYNNAIKLTDVKIFANAIETPDGKVEFNDIRNIKIQQDQPLLANPESEKVYSRNYKMLLIEGRKKEMFVISEADFPLTEIIEKLKEVMDQEKSI